MEAEPWQYNPIFTGPVKYAIFGDNMQIIYEDGSKETLLFLAPRPSHVIIGRELELLTLKQQLFTVETTSQCALVGLPGIGKTALATILAWDPEILKRFTGGVLWANLGPHADPDAQLNRWARALSLDISKEPMLDVRIAQVQAALAGRPFLLVLDDVWNEEQADILSQVTGPGCALLLTTRDETIARAFAHATNILRIEELAEAHAIQLLGELCPQIQEHTVELSHLARAVGGLPLGLRLIGGYLASHITFASETPQVLESLMQVEERLGLRDRQRRMTLQEVIGLSVQALPDEASRQVFTRLGAFAPKPASFSLNAAQNVTGATLPILGTLVRRSLLEKVDEERVTIHQSLADVAVAALPAGDTAIARHANYYLALLKDKRSLIRLNKDDQIDWSLFALELPQMRHAWNRIPDSNPAQVLEFASEITGLLREQGLWRELITWMERGLRAAQALGQVDEEAIKLGNLGLAHQSLGEHQIALDYHKRALVLWKALNNRKDQGAVLNNIGSVYQELGEREEALRYYTQALEIMEETASDDSRGVALYNLGRIYHELEDHKQSLLYIMQALPLVQQGNNLLLVATIYQYLGGISNTIGEHRWALRWLEQSLRLVESLSYHASAADTLRVMADVYKDIGNHNKAEEYYTKAQSHLESVENPSKHAAMHTRLGETYYKKRDYQQAIAHFKQALPFWEKMNNRRRQVRLLLIMGKSLQKLGQLQQAQQCYEQALALHDLEGNIADETLGTILHDMGEVRHAQGEASEALDYYTKAQELRKRIDDTQGLSTTLHNIGILFNDNEEYTEGLAYLQQALSIRKTIGWLSAERLTLLAMTVSLNSLRNWKELEQVMSQVVELSRKLNDPELQLDISQLEEVRERRRQTGM